MHVAIVGAGVSGISTAWQLTRQFPDCQITLIDKRAPGTLCSNKGTEAFRTFWPGDSSAGIFTQQLQQSVRALIQFSEHHGSMELQKRGYAFFSEHVEGSTTMREIIADQTSSGSGESEYKFIQDASTIREWYPGFSGSIQSALVMHNCGWFRTREYLKSMLFEAMAGRFTFVRNGVKTIDPNDKRVTLGLDDNTNISVDKVILCSGQESVSLLSQMGFALPISYESHSRAVFPDPQKLLCGMPFSFFSDAFSLSFTEQELRHNPALADFHGRILHGHFHARENWIDALGKPSLQALWTYDSVPEQKAVENIPPEYVSILLKGLQKLCPAYVLSSDELSKIQIHTGIYTKMPDNMPCIGTLIRDRVYINSALSGFGYMFSQQSSLLISQHCIDERSIPEIFNPFRQKCNETQANSHLRGQM